MGERLPELVSSLNSQVTRLTKKNSVDTMKEKVIDANYTFKMQHTFPDKHKSLWVCSSLAVYVVCI